VETWKDVIEIADTMLRNSFAAEIKTKWLSSALAQVFQMKFNRDVTYSFFNVTIGTKEYALPTDCEPDDIVLIQIESGAGNQDFEDYEYREVHESGNDKTYTILNGKLQFDANFTEDKQGLIFYVGTPRINSLADPVPLPFAYRELMVFALCERMAAARGDADRKNNFKADFDQLLSDYLMHQMGNAPEYYTPRDELPRRKR